MMRRLDRRQAVTRMAGITLGGGLAAGSSANSIAWANEAKPETTTPDAKDVSADAENSPERAALRAKLHGVLDRYYQRRQSVDLRSPWAVLHWIVAFGCDTMLYVSDERPAVTAVGWLLWNGRCAGQGILYVDGEGRIGVHRGAGVQGHDGQLLGYISQGRAPLDYPVRCQGKSFTLADIVEYEKRTCEPGTELTFKLIGLANYLPTDAKWKSQSGQDWTLERMVREELTQDVRSAACGGSHRMMGFSTAVRRRKAQGAPMTGDFARAEQFVSDYHRYTFALQNSDGSFSSEWFKYRAQTNDAERALETSGHVLEWLTYSLSDAELAEPRMTKAVNSVADLLASRPDQDWKIGPLGHALHGLLTYERRHFKTWQPPKAGGAGDLGTDKK
jgi:hypothetical protein